MSGIRSPWLLPGTEAPEEWGGEVELALFRSPTLVEAAFLLRGPRALLLADTAFKMDASCGVPRGEIWQARLTYRPLERLSCTSFRSCRWARLFPQASPAGWHIRNVI